MKSPDLNDVFGTGDQSGRVVPPKPFELRQLTDKVLDFARDWLINEFVILGTIGGLLIFLFAWACTNENKAKAAHEARFMAECQQERKHYECEALWRQGEEHDHYVPVVIPMAVGR